MDGNMFFAFMFFHVKVSLLTDRGNHGGTLEVLPNNIDCQSAGMTHVGPIVAVVAQLIENQFVGWIVDGECVVVGTSSSIARSSVLLLSWLPWAPSAI